MVYLRLKQGKVIKEEIVSSLRHKDKIRIGFIVYVLRTDFYSLHIAFNDLLPGLHSGLSGFGIKWETRKAWVLSFFWFPCLDSRGELC